MSYPLFLQGLGMSTCTGTIYRMLILWTTSNGKRDLVSSLWLFPSILSPSMISKKKTDFNESDPLCGLTIFTIVMRLFRIKCWCLVELLLTSLCPDFVVSLYAISVFFFSIHRIANESYERGVQHSLREVFRQYFNIWPPNTSSALR